MADQVDERRQIRGSMTSYQRIAALVLRLIGTIWTIFFVLLWCMYIIEMVSGVAVQRYPLHTILGNVAYVAMGLVLIIFSKTLGRLIGRGLEP